MINKKSILTAALICLTFVSANASNLTQIDVKKTSDSAVDLTFYTTGTYGNAMVTRKSNNKYVILMPNVAGKTTSAPDLSAVKDIITDIDVKNVDDGMSGYTKITLITKRPLTIKTHMQKAVPLSQEEKEAKALIAQVKTHPKQTVAPVEPKKELPKTTITTGKAAANVQNIIKKVENKPSNKLSKSPDKEITDTTPTKIPEVKTNKIEPVVSSKISNNLDIKEVENIEKISKTQPAKKHRHAGWAVVVLPLLGLYLLAKMIRNSIQKSNVLKASFAENLAERPHVQENYDDIINDTELNWQERYQKFVEESKGVIKNRKYNFIKTDEPLNDIDKKRLELENTLSKTSELYEPHQIDITEEQESEVKSEDEIIQKEINTVKLKAFAKPASLLKSNRNKVKKTLPSLPKAKEGRFVKLQENNLNASSRSFQNANLKVSDLIKTGNRYLEKDNKDVEMIEKEQNYLMSSIDEYFNLLDKEQARKMSNPNEILSQKVAASLAQVKPSMNVKKAAEARVSRKSNPIAKKSNNEEYMNGLIVKSGYNIDENRGFYLVKLDGVTALVGRVKEEIFVLKKFDENVEKLQVRLDNENVYMVKAGSFKSLVDVDETKMGVLIEL